MNNTDLNISDVKRLQRAIESYNLYHANLRGYTTVEERGWICTRVTGKLKSLDKEFQKNFFLFLLRTANLLNYETHTWCEQTFNEVAEELVNTLNSDNSILITSAFLSLDMEIFRIVINLGEN